MLGFCMDLALDANSGAGLWRESIREPDMFHWMQLTGVQQAKV